MTNYIVYEKKECSCLYAKECGDWYEDECNVCEDKGYIKIEVPLDEALMSLLLKNSSTLGLMKIGPPKIREAMPIPEEDYV